MDKGPLHPGVPNARNPRLRVGVQGILYIIYHGVCYFINFTVENLDIQNKNGITPSVKITPHSMGELARETNILLGTGDK